MEKHFESWLRDQQTDWQSPNPNSSSGPFGAGPQFNVPSLGHMLTPPSRCNGILPVFAFASQQPRKASLPEEPCGWFYGLPRYRQGFTPVANSLPKEQLSVPSPNENCNEKAEATNGVQKKFLVFDQSGDQTRLIFSSGIGEAPIPCHLPSWNKPRPQSAFELKKELATIKKDEDIGFSYPLRVDECVEDDERDDVRSEMREDTEELNALLYSDDDTDYSEDEEETSTGHSPSTMTGFHKQEWPDVSGEEEEEVASSAGPGKRHKLDNGGYDVVSLEDTASSQKSGVNCCDDAELSCCGDNGSAGNGSFEEETDSLSSCKKRSRKEKVRETISVLQNLIPGGKNGKDAIMVIDEAIHYLRSLKVKAKTLGLDSL